MNIFYWSLSRVLIWWLTFFCLFVFPFWGQGVLHQKSFSKLRIFPSLQFTTRPYPVLATVCEIINQEGKKMYLLINTDNVNRIVTLLSAVRQLSVSSLLVWERQLRRQGGKLSPLRWRGCAPFIKLTALSYQCKDPGEPWPWDWRLVPIYCNTNALNRKERAPNLFNFLTLPWRLGN